MGIALIGRGVNAISSQLNAYYRVFRGLDPDNIDIRLPAGGAGAVKVHHSGTNATVFQVTDAGASGTITVSPGGITNGMLADGAVTSAKIFDDTIVNADVKSDADIVVTKLAHVGANNVLKSNGSTNVAGQVVNADVAAGASILLNKLNHVGAGNVLKSDGSTNVAGQVVNADVASAAAIVVTKLAHVGTGNVLKSNGTTNVAAQVSNADVDAAAAIGLAKLFHVGTGNVLKSNGTANVGAQIVNADVAAAADIDGSKLLDASIPASKLGAGITAPGVALLATTGRLGAPAAATVFGSISAAYTSLEIRVHGRGVPAGVLANIALRFNGDVTASYYSSSLHATPGSAPASSEILGANYGEIGTVVGNDAGGGFMGGLTIWIPDYRSTQYKSAHGLWNARYNVGATQGMIGTKGVLWVKTAVITSVEVGIYGGNWAANTIVSLYGYV